MKSLAVDSDVKSGRFELRELNVKSRATGKNGVDELNGVLLFINYL